MTSYNIPQDIDTEKTVLSCAISKRDALNSLMEHDEEIFYLADHREIYKVLKELYEQSEDIDLSVILSRVAGRENLVECITSLLSGYSINFQYLLSNLASLKHKRDILSVSKDLFSAVISGSVEYTDFLDKLVEIAQNINKPKEKDYCSISELSTMDLDELFQTGAYVSTGFGSLDEKLIGLFRGQLVIIAARPGLGKSTLALNIADITGLETLLFSLEMKRTEIYARILSRHGQVEAWKIEGKKLSSDEVKRVSLAHLEAKDKLKITLFDSGQNFSKIISNIHRFYEMKKPELIIIDYLQLIKGAAGENQNIRIGNITGTIKNLAMQLNIPIILLSQLSRENEKQARRPVLSDLRDSGNIEQDADVVIFLHEEDERTEVIIAKSRKGKKGKILTINFDKPFSRFVDIQPGHFDRAISNPEYFNN